MRVGIESSLLETIIRAVSVIRHEIAVKIDNEGFKSAMFDEPRVSYINLLIPKSMFSVWEVENETQFAFDGSDVLRVIRRRKETIELRYKNGIEMRFIGRSLRIFRFPTRELEEDEYKVLDIENTKFMKNVKYIGKITVSGFLSGIEDIRAMKLDRFPKIRLIGDSGRLFMDAVSTAKVEFYAIEFHDEVIKSWNPERVISIYPLKPVYDVLKAVSNLTDVVKIYFGNNIPLVINAELPFEGKLIYVVAPHIEGVE